MMAKRGIEVFFALTTMTVGIFVAFSLSILVSMFTLVPLLLESYVKGTNPSIFISLLGWSGLITSVIVSLVVPASFGVMGWRHGTAINTTKNSDWARRCVLWFQSGLIVFLAVFLISLTVIAIRMLGNYPFI